MNWWAAVPRLKADHLDRKGPVELTMRRRVPCIVHDDHVEVFPGKAKDLGASRQGSSWVGRLYVGKIEKIAGARSPSSPRLNPTADESFPDGRPAEP